MEFWNKVRYKTLIAEALATSANLGPLGLKDVGYSLREHGGFTIH